MLRVTHRPGRGGHDRIVTQTLRQAASRGLKKIVLIIDYEADRASAAYTKKVCPPGSEHKITLSRGASIYICRSRVTPHLESRSIEVIAIVYYPRSEEVLQAIAPDKLRNPRDKHRVKSDPSYVRRILEDADIPRKLADRLARWLVAVESQRE